MTVPMYSTSSVAASVLIPLGPMGQSELSMSMTCLARTPCGVLMLIRTPASPAFAGGVEVGAQPSARAVTRMALQISASARLSLCV